MEGKEWSRLVVVLIPIIWIWFALIGALWNPVLSLFIAISVTIVSGTLYSILEPVRTTASK